MARQRAWLFLLASHLPPPLICVDHGGLGIGLSRLAPNDDMTTSVPGLTDSSERQALQVDLLVMR